MNDPIGFLALEPEQAALVGKGVAALRLALAQRLEDEIRPLIERYRSDGGYNCCGCPTYDQILDHAIRIVRGDVCPTCGPTTVESHPHLPYLVVRCVNCKEHL